MFVNQTILGLFDKDGREKARFGLDERGAALTFGAEIEDENPTIILRAHEKAEALFFRDKEGKSLTAFGIIEGKPTLKFYDENRDVLFEAPEQD